MTTPSASWPITARVAVAGFIGLVVSVLAIEALLWLSSPNGAGLGGGLGGFGLFLLQTFAGTMILIPIGLLLAGPLILMAIIAGAVFRPAIERHLLAWSAASPFAVWLFACVFFALTTHNAYFETHGLIDRLSVTIGARDKLLFLFGPLVSGLAFYALSVPRGRPSAG